MPEHTCQKRLRIAYLTANDPNDKRSWSGTDYYMARALQKHCDDILQIGPLHPIHATVGKIIKHGFKLLGGPTYLYAQTTSMAKKLAAMAEKRLAAMSCNVIFAPAGSVPLAYLRTEIPIVYLSDATFHLMVDYYHEFSSLFPPHARMGDEIERLAITNAKRLIYPSSWAARSAIEDYGADPLKVHIIPLGANFDVPPSREDATRFHQRDVCRLLFVGVSWERKGGDIAFETLLELLRLGVPSELIVVGCQPPPHVSHNRLRVFPFLNKNNPEECKLLYTLYYQSDFFVLPTRAECFGIVLCEANAFGLPVLSTETGGVSEIVRNGVNGFLLPLEARGDRYAAVIRDIYDDSTRYADLRKSSRGEFESRLNWDAWGRQVCEIFRVAVNTLPHE